MNQLLKVEFHCHTVYSPDSLNFVPDLLKRSRQKGITRLIITEHNSIYGALLARELDPELVIIGEEILTQKGELLAAFVKEKIPAGLAPMQAIERLKNQGAFISVSHPFDLRRHGWEMRDLLELIPFVDAIEVFNARCINPEHNRLAQDFANDHNLAGTVGSDAHILYEVGQATLSLPYFESADGLRAVIRQGKQNVRLSPAWVHLGSGLARLYKRFVTGYSVT
ncbi:MAG: PHP domain-containing protein [Anaerolineaceae bacterium]|nr:PHP domain-containing protein [Anaerolineaceae bacterium]